MKSVRDKPRRSTAQNLLIAGAVGCGLILILYAVSLFGARYINEENPAVETVELNVGETYDLRSCFDSADRGYFDVHVRGREEEAGVFLDSRGFLHGTEAGLYEMEIELQDRPSLIWRRDKEVAHLIIAVHDTDFQDYTSVESYDDFSSPQEWGKYILKSDIVVRGRADVDVLDFSGILVNPEGYEITIADDQPLFARIGQYSVVDGLTVRTDEGGIRLDLSNGILATDIFGYASDCTAEGDVYAAGDGITEAVGFAGYINGYVVRCSYRGSLFCQTPRDQYSESNVYSFAESFDEDAIVRDCTVYADAYRGGAREVSLAFTAAPVVFSEEDGLTGEAFAAGGNRVFDLAGEHEVDFGKPVRYTVGVSNTGSSHTSVLYAGSVAEWNEEDVRAMEEEGAQVSSCTLNGGQYSAQKLYVPADSSVCKLTLDARYKETSVEASGKHLTVRAAEERVVLPDGVYSNEINVGVYSPRALTLAFSAHTEMDGDDFDLAAEGVALTADLSASDIYEEGEYGNIFRNGGSKLCLFRGPVENGRAAIPDGVTETSDDPFGELEFTELYANDLEALILSSPWAQRLVRLRLGANTDPSSLPGKELLALRSIETDERDDGYTAAGGILYKNGDYYCVPPAFAAGETLVLAGSCDVLRNSLRHNLAEEIVFANDGEVEGYACSEAACRSVMFAGAVTVREGAFDYCNELVSVGAQGNAAALLEQDAFSLCGALEKVRLNDGFVSVAYNAVQSCSSFAGYSLAENCDRFIVSDGVLFVEGEALLPPAWGGEEFVVPANIANVRLYSDDAYEPNVFRSVVLGADVQNITAQAAFESYVLSAENPYLSIEDGVLFDSSKQELLSWPSQKAAETYTVPATVKRISENAFYGAALRNIVCPNVAHVGENAFYGSALVTASFGEGLLDIGARAFYLADALEAVELPETLLSIGSEAFRHAGLLESVVLPAGLEEIGSYAFSWSGLRSLALPSGVIQIGEGAFHGTEIERVVLPEGMVSIPDSMFREAGFLREVVLPSTLQSIGSYAFERTDITEVALPAGLRSIGSCAFEGTKLTQIVLPAGLQSVGRRAFYGCDALAEVTAENPDTVYETGCFEGTPFIKDGKTAVNGAIYLGNTLIALHGAGEELEVRYGTARVLSLISDEVQVLKLPASLVKFPSFGNSTFDLPALREVWLGEAPDEFEASFKADSINFYSDAEQLLVHVPKAFTFGGASLESNVAICYGGTAEEFGRYADVAHYAAIAEHIYFFDATGETAGSWHYEDGDRVALVKRKG